MAKIREGLVGSVIIPSAGGEYTVLSAGDVIPDGVHVGDHLTAPTTTPGRKAPAKS